ncbi:hypothetical protein R1sor_023520 [Riccia sorocarpa]|uniref:Uncharacterized protein n=1 Tax=Riccia sorocarpa TaxID=122646 RepID=A0ABD3GQ46_9MARC
MGGDRDLRSLKQATRDRILKEMLGAVKSGGHSTAWKVLIVDEVTVKVLSKICKVSDIQEEGISVVEDLKKSRQPQRTLEAVYFMYPSRESVSKFMQDMSGSPPLYKKAHVFFSTPLAPHLLQLIKSSPVVLSRIASLAELNLEFWVADTQGFITNHDSAMRQIVGGKESTLTYDSSIESIASRLATVFASLKEFPTIRYRATPAEANPATSGRDAAPLKLAEALSDKIKKYKGLPQYPQSESCDLIILTRAVDPVAPVIHEWTYNSLCHDLLPLDGNKFMYEVTTGSGKVEKKEVLLEEHDNVWTELRDMHIADVSLRLDEKMKEFRGRNKAAQLRGGGSREDLSTKDMQKIAQALPQYQDELEKLSLHIHIATTLNKIIKDDGLNELSDLEQNLVFGGASSKEMIKILQTRQDLSVENRVRLLMIWATTHPDKCEPNKLQQWLKLARLTDDDAVPIINVNLLGTNVGKKHKINLSYGNHGAKAYRKGRPLKEGDWQNARFFPVLEELLENVSKDNLSKEEYPRYQTDLGETPSSSSASPSASPARPVASVRSRHPSWARSGGSSSENLSPQNSLSTNGTISGPSSRKLGKRIVVFIIGGMTYSELCTAHKMTAQLNREVIIGSTSLENPTQFIAKVRTLTEADDLDFDI